MRWRILLLVLAAIIIVIVAAEPHIALRRARISGPSMAPRLLGPHFRLACPKCGSEHAVGVEFFSEAWPVTCPLCGASWKPDHKTPQPGERVWYDHRWSRRGLPERWEIVALRSPEHGLVVKRVLGLPGERVSLIDGDLWIDGRPNQRTREQLLDTCLSVDDDRLRQKPRHTRWRPRREPTGWSVERGRRVYRPSGIGKPGEAERWEAIEWLDFRIPGDGRRASASSQPLTFWLYDDYPYNAHLTRVATPVRDVMVTVELTLDEDARVALRLGYAGVDWIVRLDGSQRTADLHGDAGPSRHATIAGHERGSLHGTLTLAACDGQVRAWWDEQLLVASPVSSADRSRQSVPDEDATSEAPAGSTSNTEGPVAPGALVSLGAGGGDVSIGKLVLYRDLYILVSPSASADPHALPDEDGNDAAIISAEQTGTEATWRLGADELFVVGDNLPVSEDSRTWETPVVRGMLVGRVYGSQ